MKLHNLTIDNFRGFDHFTLNHLGRVNLLVGTNNSGKTTVLEAIYLLLGSYKLWAIWSLLANRGETSPDENRSESPSSKPLILGVRHFFPRHSLQVGARFEIHADSDEGRFDTQAFIHSADPTAENGSKGVFENGIMGSTNHPPVFAASPLEMNVKSLHPLSHPEKLSEVNIVIDRKDGFTSERLLDQRTQGEPASMNYSVRFVTAHALSGDLVADLYDSIALTKAEELVLEALRLIEPKIERMATTGSRSDWGNGTSRGKLLVRLAGEADRVPIGSMGEGMWRLLGLALAVVHSQNSILLIDEIDTGLHHSVMDKMWRFLDECSKRFNVQIIATTHSRDCYQSLAAICREEIDEESQSDITIQRIERNRSESVVYSEAAIIAAAERDVEVR